LASIGPGVTSLLGYASEGDTIIAHTLDRLARNLREVLGGSQPIRPVLPAA
jgi:DNA invertase Pin-like site-specific DNA recombinase